MPAKGATRHYTAYEENANASAKSMHLGVPEDVGGAHRGKAEVGVAVCI